MKVSRAAICFPVLVAVLAFAQSEPKQLSKGEAMAAVASKVSPDYPAMAKQLKIEGTVELQAVVAESGIVEHVNILSGNPILTRPAADALKKWKFTPLSDGGKPVKALAPVAMTFKL